MRVALLTPYLPAPANTGGRIRIHELARALARVGEVSLYACAGARETRRLRASDELSIYRRVRARNSDVGIVPPFVTPHRVRECCPARLAFDLRRDHAHARFDVVVVEHSYACATARVVPGVPLVVDEHNVESAYRAEYDAADREAATRESKRQVALLAAWERRVWERASLVTCVSDDDAREVRAHREGRATEVVPNGAALGRIPFVPPSRRRGEVVLFVGLMTHAPNIAAAQFLTREVMPRVWTKRPSARLVLCGRAPVEAVRALANARVEVTGTVDSVVPSLDRARVYANALFQGAGSSLKVPEALAAGIPLVSTARGARGFGLRAGEHYRAAESADAFATEIVATLEGDADDGVAARGRELASRFDWATIGPRFAALVTSVGREGAR